MFSGDCSRSGRASGAGAGEISSENRVWSVYAFIEDGRDKKSCVPYHWADNELNLLYWPPKGKLTGDFIRKWVAPNKITWRSYRITKTLMEYGSKELCEEYLRNQLDSTTADSSMDDTVSPSPSPVRKRVLTPTIHIRRSPRLNSDSPDRTQTQGFRVPSPLSLQSQSIITPTPARPPMRRSLLDHPPKRLRHMSDGDISFDEMDTKKFQYNVLMRLGKMEDAIDKVSYEVSKLAKQRTGPEEPIFNFSKMESYIEFVEIEAKLSNEEFKKSTISMLKKIGVGNTIRHSLRVILQETMVPNLVSQFNRDGKIKGKDGNPTKKAFGQTKFYNCIQDALVNTFTRIEINAAIGDVLKRAKPAI